MSFAVDLISTFGGECAKPVCGIMSRINACVLAVLTAKTPLSNETMRDLKQAKFASPAPA